MPSAVQGEIADNLFIADVYILKWYHTSFHKRFLGETIYKPNRLVVSPKVLMFDGDFVMDKMNRIEIKELEPCTWVQHYLQNPKSLVSGKRFLYFSMLGLCLLAEYVIFAFSLISA